MPGPPPRDASGPAEPLTIRLSPTHRRALDDLAHRHASSRSEVVADLIVAAVAVAVDVTLTAEGPTRAPRKGRRDVAARIVDPQAVCRHPKAVTRGKGPLMECPDCGLRGINLR